VKEKFITTNELANDASRTLKNLKNGEGVVVLRYSSPVGVLLTWEDYKKMENIQAEHVQECRACLEAIKKSSRNRSG